MSLLTLVGFACMTVLAAVLHVRKSAASGTRATTPCPACGHAIAGPRIRCPHCDVPLQAFEVAAAPVAQESPERETAGEGALHAVVRADVCVGCGACVPACPIEGAIRLRGKLAVVDKDACRGSGACAEACPVGGIVLTTGAMVHQVEVPDVRKDFQTNIPGVYIVGELGGRGLIKNAINEGKIAAQNVARELRRQPRPRRPGTHDLVIVGSGPGGLSAALEAKASGLDCVILEQGTMADSVRKYPRHKLLLAEPVAIPLYGDLWVADAPKETLLRVWETVVSGAGLEIRTNQRVENVTREGSLLRVEGSGFRVLARRVILALGRRGTPRRLGIPGEESEHVFYEIAEMETFRGRRVLVVGGGDSALESAVGLSNQQGTVVTLSHRRATFERAKDRNVAKLQAAEAAGKLRVLRESTVERIDDGTATIRTAGGSETLPCDNVIVRIGGEPPAAFLDRAGIRIVRKELPLEEAREAVHA